MKKAILLGLFTLFSFAVVTPSAHAGYEDPLPNASCTSTRLVIYMNPRGVSSTIAVRLDDLSNGWNPTSPLPGDDIKNSVKGSAYIYDNPVPGRWYAWWFHRVDAQGVYGPAQSGYLQCPVQKIAKPSNLSHSYDYPTVTLKWDPVPGAKYYAIRVDNTATPWNGDQENLNDGDHMRNKMTETTFQFKAARGRGIAWWVHAVDQYGTFTEASGEYFVTPK